MTRAHPLLINDLTMDCGQRAPLEAAAGVAASLYETPLSLSLGLLRISLVVAWLP